jgi:hypothetical protein
MADRYQAKLKSAPLLTQSLTTAVRSRFHTLPLRRLYLQSPLNTGHSCCLCCSCTNTIIATQHPARTQLDNKQASMLMEWGISGTLRSRRHPLPASCRESRFRQAQSRSNGAHGCVWWWYVAPLPSLVSPPEFPNLSLLVFPSPLSPLHLSLYTN